MTDHEDDLMRRRSELLARIATQRDQLAVIGSQLQSPLALADQGMFAFRFMRRHPLLIAGAAALLVIRRRGVAGLAGGLLGIWKSYRYFVSVTDKLLSREKLPGDVERQT